MERNDGRANDEIRAIKFTTGYILHPEGSVLAECGNTKVICNATVEESVPHFLKGQGKGWVSAEYSMLPRATHTRNQRDIAKLRQNPRSVEIQRLIGRSLRAAIDFKRLGERSILIDCDVLQADGGTRTTAVNGGYIALYLACQFLLDSGVIEKNPVIAQISAISAGLVGGQPMLDLCYSEDSAADADFNIVVTGDGHFIEMQGTGEKGSFSLPQLNEIIALAQTGCSRIMQKQRETLALG